jgi:hypothetical protein
MNSGWSSLVVALVGFMGVIIGLLVSLAVSWLNNQAATERQELQLKHDAERQERQLCHDAEQRRTERERSLQREIYLGAIEAMGKWQWYLGRMADMNLPDEKFPPMLEDSGQLIGKAYVIGSLDTLKTITDLNKYFIENGLTVLEKRLELVVAKQKVAQLETDYLRATERAAQLSSDAQIAYESGDQSLSSLLSAVDENNRQLQRIETSLNNVRREIESLTAALLKEGVRASNEFASVCMDAVIAIRHELGLEMNEAFENELQRSIADVASKGINNYGAFIDRLQRKNAAGAEQV